MAEKNNAKLPDLATLIAAGINPKTGLPLKLGNLTAINKEFKFKVRRIFRIMDEQRACNTFVWSNLPAGISSQEFERLLYLKYTLCFFYFKELDQFFIMPYALDGTIDFYGRFNTIHPVPMTSGAEREDQSKEYKQKAALLSTKKLNVIKDVVVDLAEITEDLLTNSAVIIRDYTNQMGQMGEARYILNDDLIEAEADCLCFMRTNLLLGTGVQAIRVPDADAEMEVESACNAFYSAALNGKPYLATTSKFEFQELQPVGVEKSSEYFLALQSLDNILLNTHGIPSSGIYEKKAHVNQEEYAVNATNIDLVMSDRLRQRQNFCNIVNSIWGTNIWCDISEEVVGYDVDQDGVAYEESTDSGSGYSTDEEGGEE